MLLHIKEEFKPQSREDQAAVLSSAAKPEPRKGCCLKCRQAYFWTGPLKLQGAKCPGCGGPLVRTMWYEKGPWFSCRVSNRDKDAKVPPLGVLVEQGA